LISLRKSTLPYKDPEKRKAYLAEWRRKHPDYMREYMQRYYADPETKARVRQQDNANKKCKRAENPEHERGRYKDYYRRNRRSVLRKNRNNELRTKYGFSLVEYDRMFAAQGGLCAICSNSSDRALHTDHDHETGEVRGLLCGSCNKALGLFKDDPARIQEAAYYLLRRGKQVLTLVGSAGA